MEICTYSFKDTNINVLVTLNFGARFSLFLSKFQNGLENLKIWNLQVGAKDTNINIWVTLKIAQNVIIFYKCL
jgi:hypothetical protein